MLKKIVVLFLSGSLFFLVSACAQEETETASVVTLIENEGVYRLQVDGEPYFIKGSGGDRQLDLLAATGGNTLRTWGADGIEEYLDAAHEAGLKVAAGLWIEHERHGFDYDNETAVLEQINRHKEVVNRYKDHPGVLLWILGNEVELEHTNKKVYSVIENLAAYIQEVDPNHPVATVSAHPLPEVVADVITYCPSIDIYGVNTYSGISVAARDLKASGWEGPFMITEWGPSGHWEVPSTTWGASIEPTSTEKATSYVYRYKHILEERDRCLGSFSFFWGQKQERTPTWYGVFTEEGRYTEILDTLSYLWKSEFPVLRAPQIANLQINGLSAVESVIVQPNSVVEVGFQVIRGRAEELTANWVIMRESDDLRSGGDAEARPEEVAVVFESDSIDHTRFVVPSLDGQYRLYLYLNGLGNTVATANIPFLVDSNSE